MTAEEEKPDGQMMEDVTGAFASHRKVAGTQEFKMQLDQIGIESGLYPDQAMKQTSAILELLQRGNVGSQSAKDAASEELKNAKTELAEWQTMCEGFVGVSVVADIFVNEPHTPHVFGLYVKNLIEQIRELKRAAKK
jgi:cAMP phosphodiesterase